MKVTIKDIAKAADVSHTTVSRALRGHPAIADETIIRIRKIADELGYIPSAAARSLKTNRSGVLGVIVTRIANEFFAEVLDGIQDVLRSHEYNLFLTSLGEQQQYEENAIQAMIEQRIEGVIICSTYVSSESCKRFEDVGIPVVVVHNRALEDSNYSIYHDDLFGGKTVTNHLIQQGHKRIAYIASLESGRTNLERMMGYKQALEAAKILPQDDYIASSTIGDLRGGYEAAMQLLELGNPPSAIFCYNDLMAVGAMQAIQSVGLRVPDDCSVAGFDNIALSSFIRPSLTTFDQPKYQLGAEAANMIIKLRQNPGLPASLMVLRGNLVQRESTVVVKSKA